MLDCSSLAVKWGFELVQVLRRCLVDDEGLWHKCSLCKNALPTQSAEFAIANTFLDLAPTIP